MSFNLLNIGELVNPRGGQGHEAPPRPIFFPFSCSFQEQLTKTRMHSSRMPTARSSSHLGVYTRHPRGQASPRTRPPREQAHPPGPYPPGPGTPLGTRHHSTPPPGGQKHTCKHITLPQTSFADGNNRLAPSLGNPGSAAAGPWIRLKHLFVVLKMLWFR